MDVKLYEKALKIATNAHEGQTRKFGVDKDKPYIIHPIRVAKKLKGLSKVVAILHDVLEDTKVTESELLKVFPKDVVEAVKLVTKKRKDNYFDFILRIADFQYFSMTTQIALEVKLADLKDNLRSLAEGSLKDKYRFAIHMIEESIDIANERGFWIFVEGDE